MEIKMKSIFTIFFFVALASAGLLGDLDKIGKSIAKGTNNYVIKPVASAEQFVEKEVTSAAKAVGNGVSSGAKSVAHETVAMYDHLTTL